MTMNRGTPTSIKAGGPELPAFVARKPQVRSSIRLGSEPYSELLNRLRGELGFRHQQSALRWLLEQLETSQDLRHLILVLLQEGEA